jgi:hypothetical protein
MLEGRQVTSPFDKTYDSELQTIITDYNNLDNPPDTSKGSMAYITASVMAALAWGLRKFIVWVTKQIVPGVENSTEYLDRHGGVYDFDRLPDESDQDYLNRLFARIQQAPGGGNEKDYKDKAQNTDNIFITDGSGNVIFNKYVDVRGYDDHGVPGYVILYTIPSDETIIDNGANTYEDDLRNLTQAYITAQKHVGTLPHTVTSSKPEALNITVDVTEDPNTTFNQSNFESQVQDYVNTLSPNEIFYNSAVVCLARSNGAKDADVTSPATSTSTPTLANHFRLGTITIT